ncbi:MAG TPA: dephospho-CoA kinase [Candidatus Hydrogenedentes bacterium]|mgnify:CR=1 FL=1|nr:dephospho-CoA kinase [Candidatus Hydrogenedentota bacterium]HOL78194.1 dephospho-CoA kinase [Candidatus Hydrogenedentota bacterium]HPO87209.1 dephospho-CoA kinase [Candidatus Hydrogenedentota bacterium]
MKQTHIIPQEKPAKLREMNFSIYGLTGGAGSGKSEVARVLEHYNLPVIYADRVGHELIAPQGAAEQAVRAAFGDAILTNGVIDRKKLGKIVFADSKARYTLNSIVHPLLAREIERRCFALAEAGHRKVVIEGALLCENLEKSPFLDRLIVVHSDRELRIKRLMDKRSLSRDDAIRLIESQTDPVAKLTLADWVIENNFSLEELRQKAQALAEEIVGDAR